MRTIVLLSLALTACGGSAVTTTTHHSDDAEAAVEAADSDAFAHPDAAPEDASTAALADASAEAQHDAGGLLCCRTGQNLLVCDPSSPWVCPPSRPDGVPVPCSEQAPGCAVGDPCQGVSGIGAVVVCGW